MLDGVYEIIGGAVRAFVSSPQEYVTSFRDIAQSVRNGVTSPEQANTEVEKLGHSFLTLWHISNRNAGMLSLLLAIISAYLALRADWSADEASAKLQASVDKQNQVEQQILAELQRLNAPSLAPDKPSPPTQRSNTANPLQMPAQGALNRHERRKAAAKKRR